MTSVTGRVAALRFVVALGVVSLLADATYEGARSILGPYLAALGAGAAAVGVVAGAGELAGYLLRLVAGYAADRLRRPWLLVGAGYTLNQLAVPFLALAGSWPAAAGLVVAERAGKALRAPARDAVLASAAEPLGRGRAFGLHEALDQAGAVAGPLAVAGFVAWLGGERAALALLAVPAALCLAALAVARRLEPSPAGFDPPAAGAAAGTGPLLTPAFRWYLAGAALLGLGFADFPLLAFHLEREGVVGAAAVPALYALAMGVDAAAALVAGEWYDRAGPGTTALAGPLAAAAPALVFLGGTGAAVVGVALWGAAMGVQESTLRAGVARAAPAGRVATAYGLFHAVFGLAWFAGSAAIGALYGAAPAAAAAFAAAACGGGAVILAASGRRVP
ncbi:hypothetical protein HRbin29_02134 [bacterium HR29]|nr:hypothetical protein HRbin29_02134 [bacterium HR29]